MRLFVVLRSVFLLVLLVASLAFVGHERLCIDYIPHEVNEFVKNCKEAFYSISQIKGNPESSNRTARSIDDLNSTSSETNTTSTDLIQITTTESIQDALVNAIIKRDQEKLSDSDGLIEKIKKIDKIDKWYKTNDEIITFSAKTCFDFTINEMITNPTPQFATIVSPLRLTLIFIVTSFLVAILDLSLRMIMHQLSLIQCLIHTFIQIALWGTTLINMEMYRRNWTDSWISSGQPNQDIPVYPTEWTNFEIYAFVMVLLAILDTIIFEHLSRKIRLARSQGIYKCIDQESY